MKPQNDKRPSRIVRSCTAALLVAFALVFAHVLMLISSKAEITLCKPETLFLFLSSAICFGALSFILPRFIAKLTAAVLLILIALASCIQICFFGVFQTFSTLGVILSGTDALTDFPQIVSGTINKNKLFLLASLVPLLLALVLAIADAHRIKKNRKFQKEKLLKLKKAKKSQKRQIENSFKEARLSFKHIAICFGLVVITKLFIAVLVCGTSTDTNSLYAVLTEKKPVDATVLNLGALHAYALDGERMLLKERRTAEEIVITKMNKLLDSGREQESAQKAQENQQEAFAPPKEEEPQTKYNVLNIDFDKLIADDADDVTHQMDAYFKSRKPDAKNEYTGLFEGKNLIYITAESFASFAADPEITPTLYRMIHEGFYFTNFYTPYWEVSTTDGEYVNCVGLIPKSGTYSLKDAVKNYLPFTLGNQFRKLGYKTMAFHNYLGSYYDRNITHPHLGYQFVSMGDGYRKTDKWPDSDLEMMQETIKDYIDEDKFHVYYMTISGHLPYNFWANAMAIKNKDLVENLPYEDEAVKAFFACNIELDRALAFLLEELNKRGKAEDTVIVLAADHYPYGLELAQHRMLMKSHVDVTFELYRNSLILFNPSQEPCQVDKICSNMDIVPTLSNLFGLEYDSRLLMGHDIFSDTPPFVVLKSANVITDKLKYRSDTNTAVTLDGQSVSDEEAAKVRKQLQDEVRYSALMLDKDYYRRVLPPEDSAE
ncbi:MAG: sulfatase-like hydrolase/transferase [Spirochaetaceae bacterium]|nr:sulfatase-like hydrolase/transferase [Spirochaetaceae bacterium]